MIIDCLLGQWGLWDIGLLEPASGTATSKGAASEVATEMASAESSSAVEECAAQDTACCCRATIVMNIFIPMYLFGEMTMRTAVGVVVGTFA